MTSKVPVAVDGRTFELEYAWVARERSSAPLLVFLHEGLGSVAMWRDFPRTLCDALGWRGLMYSREGYGHSTPRPAGERWPVGFMHRQADAVLPAFLRAVGVDAGRDPPWLFGHSDGASIALLHAGRFPDAVRGIVVLAPHIFVEDLSITSIARAREAWRTTDLKAKLARYHDDPDSAFGGWNDVWLDAAFRDWNIEDRLPRIRCPVLAIQGVDDEYGTMAQIDGIARAVPQARLLKLEHCGHSPHKDQPQAVIEAVRAFVAGAPA
jgi:pimeloyl-ACP methyl ester carboxylesterase